MSLETVVILAAGEGTRMKSSTPKVLHSIAGRTLVGHVLYAVDALAAKQVRVVVGAGRAEVEAHLAEIAPHAVTVFQEKRGGTGHATQLALEGLKATGTILILAGDTPMLTSDSLSQLLAAHHAGGFTASVLTAEHPDPTGYGRIIRGDDQSLVRIVEERDADDPLVAHDRDLRRGAVLQHIQQRNDRVGGEIDVAQHAARLVQRLAKWQRDEPQVREKPFSFVWRERSQKMILLRSAKAGRCDPSAPSTAISTISPRAKAVCAQARAASRGMASQKAAISATEPKPRWSSALVQAQLALASAETSACKSGAGITRSVRS
jgi:CTP:molybdopterin cytidylyltransferase MocA